jgi:hypothetical protein
VEELVSSGAAETPYEARKGLVFYGKTENKVQEKRRKGDWKSVCSEWHMVAEGEDYPLTQREYLLKLSTSLFGLCLAGYGLKCHREIECMAMGCVPVVAADVDMDSYAVPLIAGTHYIRVNSPEDVKDAIESVSDWEKMSAAGKAWWKDNASCAGSFALTQKLIGEMSL